MKSLLRIGIYGLALTLFSTAGYAQIKSNPQAQGKVQPSKAVKPASKLSSSLTNFYEKSLPNPQSRAKPNLQPSALQNYMQLKGDKVLVDFTAKTDIATARAELQKMGVEIIASYGRVISGYVPVGSLPQLENTASVRFASPSYKPMHQSAKPAGNLNTRMNFAPPDVSRTGLVVTQGDTAQRSVNARNRYHVTGRDVKVGIMSNSYNNLGTADIGVKSGELPGKHNPFGYKKPVQVLMDADSNGTDEGRAMAEIVHDVAPAASLAFYTANNGPAAMAQGIQALADKGCNVICDDVIYFNEPFFQDGIIAQSVDAARKKGVTYLSAAGNQSIRSYESVYRPTNVEPFGPDFGGGTAHNFSADGDAPVYFQPLYVPSGGVMVLSFQWDQSSFSASGVGPESDYDVYLTDIYGNIVAAAFDDNLLSGEPLEILGYFNGTENYTFFLTIMKYGGPDVSRLKYNMYYDGLFYLTNPPIPGILAPTLVGHAKADGAIATGAAYYLNTPAYGLDTPRVEGFSAEGGVANYFDIAGNRIAPLVRKKPNIVAPDGGNTSFFDPFGGGDTQDDADSYPNFFGTSAAAPHAAGVAALMIEAEKLNNITPDQIKGVLSATAKDMDDLYTDGFDKGFDFNTGYGFINAEKAVGKVKFPNLYVKNLDLKPLCSDNPSAVRNWKISNPNPFPVEASWFLKGSDQHGHLTVEPGDTSFTTTALHASGCALPNVAVLSWKDNFDFKRFDIAFGTSATCNGPAISESNSDRLITVKTGLTASLDAVTDNLVEVYPNPSTNTFSLYLSLADKKAASIDLYGMDGRKVLVKTVSQTNGVVEIDASHFTAGVYLLHVTQGNFTKTIKLIKQ